MTWTLSSPSIIARFEEACAFANQRRFEAALRAYIGIFSYDRTEELGWLGEMADQEPASPEGQVIDSEMIGLVEIYKIDCLRHLGKHGVAFQKLQTPFMQDAMSRLSSPPHISQCFHIRLALADELDDVDMMETLFAQLLGFAMEYGDAESLVGVWNRRSRARLRLGRENELRELSSEDLATRADWGYTVPTRTVEEVAVSRALRTSTALRVKALDVEQMFDVVAARDDGPLLLETGTAGLPFVDVEVTPESLVAVSWKHVGESQISGIEEPAIAREVLTRSLEFARDFGAAHLWMDVYCVRPAGIEVEAALEWMGQLFATATVYPDWAGHEEQGDARTSGWIFQERMWTRLALRHSTLVAAVAKLIEYDYTIRDNRDDISNKDAEDLMDIARSAVRIGSGVSIDYPLEPWEFIARALMERGARHPLSDAVVDLQHRDTPYVTKTVLALAEFVKDGRTRCGAADAVVVFEPPELSVGDVNKVISAISSTRLKHESDAPAAYFGVFNDRCGTDFSPDKLPSPRQLLGRLVDTRGFDSNSTLAGAKLEMHVTNLHGRVDFGPAEQTTFGYPTTENHWKIGFCRRHGIAVLALLNDDNRSVSTAFGDSYRHALSLMFVSQADALRLPMALQPRSQVDIDSFVERLPAVVVA